MNAVEPANAATGPDPRHVFLSAGDVLRRYGWGKTRGYQNLKDRAMVPPPVVAHPARWRLDQLLAWEERPMAMAEREDATTMAAEPTLLGDLLPSPKQDHQSA